MIARSERGYVWVNFHDFAGLIKTCSSRPTTRKISLAFGIHQRLWQYPGSHLAASSRGYIIVVVFSCERCFFVTRAIVVLLKLCHHGFRCRGFSWTRPTLRSMFADITIALPAVRRIRAVLLRSLGQPKGLNAIARHARGFW